MCGLTALRADISTTVFRRLPLFGPWALTAAALLLPLILLAAPKGTVALLGVVVVAGAIDAIRLRSFHAPDRSLLAAMMLALAYGAASALWQVTPGLALPKAAQLASLMAAGFVAFDSARRLPPGQRTRVLVALMTGLTLVTVLIVVERLSNLALRQWVSGLLGQTFVPRPWVEMYFYKTAAAVCAVQAITAVAGALVRGWRMAALGLVIAMATASLITGSMTGVTVMGVAALIAALPSRWRGRGAAALIAGGLLTAPLAAALPDTAAISARISLPPSALHRIIIWHFAAGKALERPIFGWGLDASRELPGADHQEILTLPNGYQSPRDVLPLHPHNLFIQLWLELGGLGAMMVGLVLALLARAAWRLPGPWDISAVALFAGALSVSAVSIGAWQSWWLASVGLTIALFRAMRTDQA